MSGATLKVGDRVRFTVEGEVDYASNDGDYFEMSQCGYYKSQGTVEIIQKPLVVGDEVTVENKHLLPDNFILADKDGTGWESRSAVEDYSQYGPFKLVYIHDGE